MRLRAFFFAALLFARPSPACAAAEKTYEFSSGPEKVRLLELYTSQARSTCPPAEAWLSALKDDSALWKEIVPVAFHVSHWDKRGWKDRLATPEFTDRMESWLGRWRSSTPYVPFFALDGIEWSGWDREEELPAPPTLPAGVLTVKKISGNEYRALFTPDESARGPWVLHGVLLGFGVSTRIEGGENLGKTLRQDFVALRYDHKPMESTRDGYRATVQLPAGGEGAAAAQDGLGIAIWVSRQDEILPVQAAGTFLPGTRKPKKR